VFINEDVTAECEFFFNYLDSMIAMMQDAHAKLSAGLPWQKQHSVKRLLSPARGT